MIASVSHNLDSNWYKFYPNLLSVKWYLSFKNICISLIINDSGSLKIRFSMLGIFELSNKYPLVLCECVEGGDVCILPFLAAIF